MRSENDIKKEIEQFENVAGFLEMYGCKTCKQMCWAYAKALRNILEEKKELPT